MDEKKPAEAGWVEGAEAPGLCADHLELRHLFQLDTGLDSAAGFAVERHVSRDLEQAP
jgi:hypothetical protein